MMNIQEALKLGLVAEDCGVSIYNVGSVQNKAQKIRNNPNGKSFKAECVFDNTMELYYLFVEPEYIKFKTLEDKQHQLAKLHVKIDEIETNLENLKKQKKVLVDEILTLKRP